MTALTKSTAEAMLCQLLGPGLNRLAASISVLLDTHFAGRKFSSPKERPAWRAEGHLC